MLGLCWLGGPRAALADPPTVESGTWAPAGAMAEPRKGAAAVLLADGRILITGGAAVDGAPSSTAELFDPSEGFLGAAPMSVAHSRHAAVRLSDGRVLVTGG